jgi:hypothetical protein
MPHIFNLAPHPLSLLFSLWICTPTHVSLILCASYLFVYCSPCALSICLLLTLPFIPSSPTFSHSFTTHLCLFLTYLPITIPYSDHASWVANHVSDYVRVLIAYLSCVNIIILTRSTAHECTMNASEVLLIDCRGRDMVNSLTV